MPNLEILIIRLIKTGERIMTTPSFEAEPDGVLENTGENCTTVQPGLARSTEECVNTVPNNIYSLGDRIKINNPSMLSYSESFEQIT